MWSEDDGETVGLWARFPSLSWVSPAPEAAIEGIRRLVADAVADLGVGDGPVPEPIAIRKYSGKFMVRIPPEVHRQLALEAAEGGVSLNRIVSAKLSKS
jgi:predicted HicB family RNase H-like nuclease